MPDDGAVNYGHLKEGPRDNHQFAAVRDVSSRTELLTELN